tara:strand:- start:1459 stop:2061 length:603 start_codon:yes stop_codon:yes gene_type:complete
MNRIQKYIDSETNDLNDTSENYSSLSEIDSDESSESDDDTNKNKLNSIWNIWYHHQKNNWKLDSYKKIYKIKTIESFWEFNNNIDLIGGINSQHYFMMRENISPIWEDIKNKNGGCWSIKIPMEKSYELWIKLSMYIIGETITDYEMLVNGISICPKNTSTSVVKIWIDDNNKSSIQNLPSKILNEYGFNIIYKAHIPEY